MSNQKKKEEKIKVCVRWFDAYYEEFECSEVRAGNAYLWMRLTDGRNRQIPLPNVRWFSQSPESHSEQPDEVES